MLSHPRALPTGFIAPCLPSSAPQPPSGEEWLHENILADCSICPQYFVQLSIHKRTEPVLL
jgi:hypothetical protein